LKQYRAKKVKIAEIDPGGTTLSMRRWGKTHKGKEVIEILTEMRSSHGRNLAAFLGGRPMERRNARRKPLRKTVR